MTNDPASELLTNEETSDVPLTRDDLDRAIGHIRQDLSAHKTDIRDGFHGINERLDTLNSRTRKVEERAAALTARTTSVEKEIFREKPAPIAAESSLISARDTRTLVILILAIGSMFKGVEWIFEKVAMLAH